MNVRERVKGYVKEHGEDVLNAEIAEALGVPEDAVFRALLFLMLEGDI